MQFFPGRAEALQGHEKLQDIELSTTFDSFPCFKDTGEV